MKIFGVVIAIVVLVLFFGPKPNADWSKIDYTAPKCLEALQGFNACALKEEQKFTDLKAGQQKEIVWAGNEGEKTEWAIVYLHGFSASRGEILPVSDQIAESLGANIYYTRLRGHGRGGAAMGEVDVNDWLQDAADAIKIGDAIGEKLVVIGTSTGATLAALVAQNPELDRAVDGYVLISPNFKVKNKLAGIANLAFFEKWGALVAGETRSWEPENAIHAEFWTTSYPTTAVQPMMRLLQAVKNDAPQKPILFYYSPDDQVVDARKTAKFAKRWGADIIHPELGENDDPYAHVILGDALSPSQNEFAKQAILDWITAINK